MAAQELTNCLNCQKPLNKVSWQSVGRKRKYCSSKCCNLYRTGKHRTTPMRECKQCGKQFLDRKYRKTYCSSECWCKSRLPSAEFFNCVVCGKEKRKLFSPDHSNKYCSRLCFNSVKGKDRPPTNIEVAVYEELKERGLLFEKQVLIDGKFCVDAFIPSLNLVIEADGKYWHSMEKTIKKDRAENAYLTSRGYGLLRLSEEEIMNGSFVERLPDVSN